MPLVSPDEWVTLNDTYEKLKSQLMATIDGIIKATRTLNDKLDQEPFMTDEIKQLGTLYNNYVRSLNEAINKIEDRVPLYIEYSYEMI